MTRAGTARVWFAGLGLLALCVVAPMAPAYAQGVTTGSITGIVRDAQQQGVANAVVIAVHEPSGTNYQTTTRSDGRFSIPNMRVGGPYTVTVTPGTVGGPTFDPTVQENVTVNLGVATDLELFVLTASEAVVVTAQSDTVFSSERTGAATAISREVLTSMPNLSQRLDSLIRLSPQSSGMSFAGQDGRLNNITVDGSYFNNSFGLGNAPGDRTNVAPISMAAIEQIQVNVAPYDVRQGAFIGAGINTVTRSGTNQFRGSFYHQFRDDALVGTKARGLEFNPGTFEHRNTGGWAAGPVLRDRLFFFFNFEDESTVQPGTTFRANRGGEPVAGSVTRVLESDLIALSNFLRDNFDYETGPFQGYDHEVPARRVLPKIDFNINASNKVSFRYLHLDSSTDQLISDSSSLGFGNRRTRLDALNFQNSNYKILENIRSGVGEWNSVIGSNTSNSLIIGYTTHDESRESRGTMFPMVDILREAGGTVYTTFGFEPFTPNNELRYNEFQIQNNFTRYAEKHSLTFGASFERYTSENVFFPGSQSVYVYNSLEDFYTDANGFLADPNRTVSPVTLRRFQVRWMNIPGLEKPLQPLKVIYTGAYVQDEWRPRNNLTMHLGLRVDVPFFGDTGFQNAKADALTFRDEDGNPVQYQTAKLPNSNLAWSPRFGFNWDVRGNRSTQVRGGTGVFGGKPLYVWISNQIGNTGVLTGFEQLDNTTARPFHPNPNRYKPSVVTGEPASSYELALTDHDFRFPRLWRSNIAVDQRLPFGFTGTAEFIYNRDIDGIYYINANLPAAQSRFVGADNRPRWVGPPCLSQGNPGGCVTRINAEPGNVVSNAIVLKNQNIGRSWHISGALERRWRDAFIKTAYSYGESKNTVDPGSIAFGSWNGNPHSGDPNNPGLGHAVGLAGFPPPGNAHRFFLAGSLRREYLSFGATTLSFFWESRTQGNTSYVFSGDLNGDGGTANDLIYIHRSIDEMNFQTFTSGGRTFTAAEQAAAWNAYIEQDGYLRKHRGEYAVKGAVFLPLVHRLDVSVAQEIFRNIGGTRNGLEFRADIVNFGNLLNSDWGVGQRLISNSPLTNPGADAEGRATYRLRVIDGQLISRSLESTSNITDVWRVLFTIRYTFN
ncbi:MAG TPA: carboxypeptidase regulatory-like domain-containing protein [Vicinamibacterales bacterium]|nr:carboxypeptidase regulatory-like domain-containing protein [Vicinamibacterales bacterium]